MDQWSTKLQKFIRKCDFLYVQMKMILKRLDFSDLLDYVLLVYSLLCLKHCVVYCVYIGWLYTGHCVL